LKGLLGGEPLSVALFEDAAMRKWVDRTVREHPVSGILAFSGQMAPYALPHVAGRRSVMDFVDLDSDKWAQYARSGGGIRGRLYAREARTLLAFEKTVASRFEASLFVSEDEARLFRERAGPEAGRVLALSNGVDTDFFNPHADFPRQPVEPHDLAGPVVTFVGALDYKPNVDAALWFAAEVWPLIRQAQPPARFFVVGSKPVAAVTALAQQPGIVVTGRVADVRPYVAAAGAVVAPLRIARGIQNKVLEAMAMARPVVASPQAAEGIDAQHAAHLLVAADASGQAAAIVSLLADRNSAEQLGTAARRRMEQRYRWSATLAGLPALLFPDAADAGARAA
jgi:sugar transferase (PEP-CTERM/EpsH1 system associated)